PSQDAVTEHDGQAQRQARTKPFHGERKARMRRPCRTGSPLSSQSERCSEPGGNQRTATCSMAESGVKPFTGNRRSRSRSELPCALPATATRYPAAAANDSVCDRSELYGYASVSTGRPISASRRDLETFNSCSAASSVNSGRRGWVRLCEP